MGRHALSPYEKKNCFVVTDYVQRIYYSHHVREPVLRESPFTYHDQS